MANPFGQKLRYGATLTEEDEQALAGLIETQHHLEAGQDVMSEGEHPRRLTLILSGWACRYKHLEDGRRQIIALFLPGDLCEPYGILPRFMDHSVGALTSLTYARVPPAAVRAAAQASPAIEEALWWDMLVAIAIQHERAVSLGRRTATERLAHLIGELDVRLRLVGLADESGFELPMTQAELGDALGLSNVHVNRTLQELRGAGLITLRSRRLIIHDQTALHAVAQFDPTYLHLDQTHERA